MKVILNNTHDADLSILPQVVARANALLHGDDEPWTHPDAEVYLNRREKSGWLEYGLVFNYRSGGRICIGCIQRSPGADVEFHS